MPGRPPDANETTAMSAVAVAKARRLVMVLAPFCLVMCFRTGFGGWLHGRCSALAWRRGGDALELVGDRAWRMLVPAGVLVIVVRKSLAHLHDREHAAHLERAERTEPAHHRQRVVGHRHLPRA